MRCGAARSARKSIARFGRRTTRRPRSTASTVSAGYMALLATTRC